MKVGDLVREKGYPEIGLIVDKNNKSDVITYKVVCYDVHHSSLGMPQWFPREYIENECEVISESR